MGFVNTSLCVTPECVTASSNILQNLAPNYQSIDPCEDFDQYVCSGYPNRFRTGIYDPLNDAGANNYYLIKKILDSGNSFTSDESADGSTLFGMLSASYAACMDVEAAIAEAPAARQSVVDAILNIFPVNDASYNSSDTLDYHDRIALVDLQAYLNTIGVDGILSYSTFQNQFNDSSTYLPSVFPPENDVLSKYNTTQLGEILVDILPSDAAKSSVDLLGQGVLNLQAALNAAQELITDRMYYSWEDVEELAPTLSIDQVFGELMPEGYVPEAAISADAPYLQNISTVVEETPKAVVQAYFLLKAVNVVEDAFPQITTKKEDDTWDACRFYLQTTMVHPLSKVFVDAVWNDDQDSLVDAVVEDLRSAFHDRIQNASWVTDATRAVVLDKLAQIKTHIAYPTEDPDLTNATDILAFYDGYEVGSSHFNNSVSYAQWFSRRTWQNLVDPLKGWLLSDAPVLVVNAEYVSINNAIYFPAGILRSPFFSSQVPQYLSYGAFGTISGHELTHGFDASGRNYDAHGLYNTSQFDNDTTAAFDERKACFVEQFGQFDLHEDWPVQGTLAVDATTGEPLRVDGELTLNENIADAGGLATAYLAWTKRAAAEPQNNQLLPGLDGFTPEQLFFVAFGQVWCHRVNAASIVLTDAHAPNEARIRSIMENSRGFREAFQCPNPEPTCELW